MATNKRVRGIAIHRSILIGSTATPLSAIEKITCPPDHTHKWTIAVRSAASHPLPTIADGDAANQRAGPSRSREASSTPVAASGTASTSQTPMAAPSGVSTRGREHETDYHKMVGGKDDISHYIKRVQFKLHETYPQSTRNIDRAPFQVTETGWGEFDVQIKIFFVPESGEKPITTYHRLKLHPWHPTSLRATEGLAMTESAAILPETEASEVMDTTQDNIDLTQQDADTTEAMPTEVKTEPEAPDKQESSVTAPVAPTEQAPIAPPAATSASSDQVFPPVVHSWSYDELVFPEPTEAFYEILIANPPTPLPAQSSQAFSDVAAYETYLETLRQLDESSGPQGRDMHQFSGVKPPHPLHNPSGALFDALSQEAIQAEAERFDLARGNAVHQLEDTRLRLIDGERRIREARVR